MRKLTGTIFAVALLVAGAAQAAELIQANAVRLGPGSQSSFLKVVLDRYSTDAERAQWRAAFETGGQDGLIAKVARKETGFWTYRHPVSLLQIIQCDDVIAFINQPFSNHTTYVSGGACYKYAVVLFHSTSNVVKPYSGSILDHFSVF